MNTLREIPRTFGQCIYQKIKSNSDWKPQSMTHMYPCKVTLQNDKKTHANSLAWVYNPKVTI